MVEWCRANGVHHFKWGDFEAWIEPPESVDASPPSETETEWGDDVLFHSAGQ